MAKAKVQEPEDLVAELAERVQALQADLSGLADSIKAIGVGQAKSAVGSVKDAMDFAGEAVRDTVKMSANEARHQGEVAAGELAAVIGRNPLAAVLVSVGVGVVVGAMSRR